MNASLSWDRDAADEERTFGYCTAQKLDAEKPNADADVSKVNQIVSWIRNAHGSKSKIAFRVFGVRSYPFP